MMRSKFGEWLVGVKYWLLGRLTRREEDFRTGFESGRALGAVEGAMATLESVEKVVGGQIVFVEDGTPTMDDLDAMRLQMLEKMGAREDGEREMTIVARSGERVKVSSEAVFGFCDQMSEEGCAE